MNAAMLTEQIKTAIRKMQHLSRTYDVVRSNQRRKLIVEKADYWEKAQELAEMQGTDWSALHSHVSLQCTIAGFLALGRVVAYKIDL